MTDVTLTIEIDRAAAILAGKSSYGEMTVKIDPSLLTPDQRDELVRVIGTVFQPARDPGEIKIYSRTGYVTPIAEPTQEAVAKALDEHRARRLAIEAVKAKAAEDERKAKAERSIKWAVEVIEAKPEDRIRFDVPMHQFIDANLLPDDLRAALGKARKEAEEHYAAQKAAFAARLKAEEEAKAKAEVEKRAALEAFLVEHGTATQRKRRAAGLMPDDELLTLVRNHVFAPLDHLPRYERMKASDFLANSNEGAVQFTGGEAGSCSDEQFEAMEAIRSLMPGAEVTLRSHTAAVEIYGDDDVETHHKLSYRVTVNWNGHPLSREYAA